MNPISYLLKKYNFFVNKNQTSDRRTTKQDRAVCRVVFIVYFVLISS